jgi:hypothetical protein
MNIHPLCYFDMSLEEIEAFVLENAKNNYLLTSSQSKEA